MFKNRRRVHYSHSSYYSRDTSLKRDVQFYSSRTFRNTLASCLSWFPKEDTKNPLRRRVNDNQICIFRIAPEKKITK